MPSLIRMDMDERLALSFVLNVEEGGERHILDGDEASEHLNSDMQAAPWPGMRNPVMESHYEYGSRVGVWRILDLFRSRDLKLTAFATGLALKRVPAIATRLVADGHEVAAHGWRWSDYRDVPEEIEAEHIRRTVETIRRLTGTAPLGWYTGRISMNTRRLVLEHGGFLYDSDAYNDDTSYFVSYPAQSPSPGCHLVLFYAFDTNDMWFASAPGFDTGLD
ncbi:polysaccharide deacetylase family protein [Breoghania sp.]|uniref:polysaccharide deacetylase family protein n=1 Tax=Breoghania sp. TaxID=2065378 RepID=UPI00260FABEA|nr:polysaccharide deacetylase family protein [Breoghania sp.]MDJ0933231.1 polysaccharide deacetylase family protein [Breoghania sp.]